MIEISRFSPGLEQGVIDLILPIQREEFGVAVTLADQPDLLSIPGFYQQRAGNFWLALDAGRVIGTIALLDIGSSQGALRKMFVHEAYRGGELSVARRLLETLLAWSKQQALSDIYLGTTIKYLAAHRFYEKNEFCEIERGALPAAFPIMQVDTKFYRRTL
jgi:GNAT superfamily N-acetyltransferase